MPTNTEPQSLSRLLKELQTANDALCREIAERQRAEEFARRLLEELTHLSRLHIVGEMAAAIAHQLNQPLFAIMTHAEVCRRVIRSHAKNADGMTLDPGAPGIRDQGPGIRGQGKKITPTPDPRPPASASCATAQEIIPDLERITAAAEQAAEIIRRLRKMTGKRLARRSSVDLNKLVQEAASLLVSDALANNVRLRLDLAPDLPLALADSVLTQQVIINLARNAIEAMSATGGTALEQCHERELTIRTSAAGGDAVEAAVCDTGPGLPAEIKDRLFEPFFTTKPEGMGLGLSISQAIIQGNGGRLLAASNPERGMTFRFTLPVSKETKAMETDAPPPPHSTHPTQCPKETGAMKPEATVFVVDDDPLVRWSLERLLESVNLPVRSFSTVSEFRAAHGPTAPPGPSCIVLDVRMPGMSGLELQKQLAAEGVTLPIIFISGHGDISTVADAMRGGAIDFLEKPINPQRLLDRVQQALTQDREHRCSQVERNAVAARLASLTPREREVVDLVVSGLTNKEIAARHGVSSQAVDAHRAKAMRKLHADSVAELVRLVVESRHVLSENRSGRHTN